MVASMLKLTTLTNTMFVLGINDSGRHIYPAGFKGTKKSRNKTYPGLKQVAMRALEIPIQRFYSDFRPVSNGQGPAPHNPETHKYKNII